MATRSEPVELLLIDDDVAEGVLLRRHLEAIELDVRLMHVTEPQQALEHLGRHSVDAILVDFHLGAQTGLALLPAIRALGVRCPVILLSGLCDEDLAARARQAGAAYCLPKAGLSPARLEHVLAAALETSGS